MKNDESGNLAAMHPLTESDNGRRFHYLIGPEAGGTLTDIDNF